MGTHRPSPTGFLPALLAGAPLGALRLTSPSTAPGSPLPPNAFQGMDKLLILLGLCLVCSLFYRKYRNKMIAQRGYDADNLPDIILCFLALLALFAALLFTPALYLTAGCFLLLVLRRLRHLGPLHAIALSLLQIFSVFTCLRSEGRSTAFFWSIHSRPPTGMVAEYTKPPTIASQRRKEEVQDEELRRQLMEDYAQKKDQAEERPKE